MEAYYTYLNHLVNENKNEYSAYPSLKWLNPYNSDIAQVRREVLLKDLDNTSLFKKTKPYHYNISKGCKLCGLGSWSCLFITGKCNASCFYCPTSQIIEGQPTTQQLKFDTPESYTEYINHFKFKGVSFSGGEPLMVLDRTLQYLKHLRKKANPELYIWMYTNGILGDAAKYKKLASAGLDEIRFDIGATAYRLDKIKEAQGIIPNLTIEIPSIPEELENLKTLLPEMLKLGVSNLNLHQLRLTKYNAPNLLKKNYTYIPAENPIVLESELAALEIIQYARDRQIEIGINYCSFFFKNRFQKAGFRNQIANVIARPEEIITPKGYIRQNGNNSIAYQSIVLSDKANDNPKHINEILKLKYKSYFITRPNVLSQQKIEDWEKESVEKLIKTEPEIIPEEKLLFDIWSHEYIEKNLTPNFYEKTPPCQIDV